MRVDTQRRASPSQLRRRILAALAAAITPLREGLAQDDAGALAPLAGIWGGELEHNGERTTIYIELAPGTDGAMRARVSLPALHLYEVPLGKATLTGSTLALASIRLEYDAAAGRLTGTLPPDIVPVYALATTLVRKTSVPRTQRADLDAPVREPVWTVELGTPVWCDIAAAHDAVYAGGDDGRLHALDAQTGAGRWVYRAEGALRCGATIAGGRVYVTSDDGVLHCIDARDARPVWQLRVNRAPAVRLPATDPKSKYDLHGAAVTVAATTLFVGTHEGRVLALDPGAGSARWSFQTGDRILAAPFVAGNQVLVGCYDGKVYALDATRGALRWTFDAKAPVTSTPVFAQGVVVVGSRGYDLWGLDAATGKARWNRYVWFSWIESSAAVAGTTAYVGSSDAAKLFAFDAPTGRPVWTADVHGYAWGTPLVERDVVYLGTRGEAGPIGHRGNVLALARGSGRVLWRYPFPAADPKLPHGFAGSPVLAGGHVVLASIDGRVHAFGTR